MTEAPTAEVSNWLNFAAQTYGTNVKVLTDVGQDESGLSEGADPNTWDSNAAAGTPSEGMFQFVQRTFTEWATKAKAAAPAAWAGLGALDWTNWKQQALAASYALTHGGAGNWTTYQTALKQAGAATASSGSTPTPAAAPATPAAGTSTNATVGWLQDLDGQAAISSVGTDIGHGLMDFVAYGGLTLLAIALVFMGVLQLTGSVAPAATSSARKVGTKAVEAAALA